MHIAILDGHPLNPGDLSWEPLRAYGTLSIYPRTEPSLTYERAKDADIVITNKVRFDAPLLERLPKLRCIVVTATGYNIIDLQAAHRLGITICNAPAYSTLSVAQHVYALLLHIATHVGDYAQGVGNGQWTKSPDFCYITHPTIELAGRTLGIIGYGNIGSSVAEIAHALNMQVLVHTSRPTTDLPPYATKADLPTLLATADIVSLHCPLTEANHHLIDAHALATMKQGAILINTARGPLIDEAAVARALHSGQLAAFGADVLSTEPPLPDNPILSAPNAFITPHIAWATLEARRRLMDITIHNVAAFTSGHPINVIE